MTPEIVIRALAIWSGILVLAVLNGALREFILIPMFDITAGNVLSGMLLSAVILVAVYISLPWIGARHPAGLLGIGFGWAALTLVFEFSFGLWQGKTWSVMIAAYTFKEGNIWPIVLVVTALAPYLAARLRGWV